MKPNDRVTTGPRRSGFSLRYLATIAATTIVVLFLLVAALPLLHWFEVDGRRASLAEHRALWLGHGIDDYRLTIENRSAANGMPSAFRADVRDGVVISARRTDGAVLGPAFLPEPSTVEQLFALVAEANAGDPARMSVIYDEHYGYPQEIRIDPDTDVDGDETVILVTTFDPRVPP